ncbi:F-box domain-containing protein [Mycena kentingensis (nom. inval.)]|nr:F-box domain-containing protein [Mycena kentingensis (nom. inval.)]
MFETLCSKCRESAFKPSTLLPSVNEAAHLTSMLRSNLPPTDPCSVADAKELNAIASRDHLERIHSVHHSPIRRIPNEIIAEIMYEALLSPSLGTVDQRLDTARHLASWSAVDHPFIILSEVCYRWHVVAVGTPKLWSYISCSASSSRREQDLSLLSHSLRRSSGLPLSVKLRNWWSSDDETPYLDLILPHASRIRRFSGAYSSRIQERLTSSPLEGLEDLTLILRDGVGRPEKELGCSKAQARFVLIRPLVARLAGPAVGASFLVLLHSGGLHSLRILSRADQVSPLWSSSAFADLARRSGFAAKLKHLAIEVFISEDELFAALALLPALETLEIRDMPHAQIYSRKANNRDGPLRVPTLITEDFLRRLHLSRLPDPFDDLQPPPEPKLIPNLRSLTLTTLAAFSDTALLAYVDAQLSFLERRSPRSAGHCRRPFSLHIIRVGIPRRDALEDPAFWGMVQGWTEEAKLEMTYRTIRADAYIKVDPGDIDNLYEISRWDDDYEALRYDAEQLLE